MGSNRGVIAELSRDHHRVQNLLDQVRAAAPDSEGRAEVVERVTTHLARHLTTERERLHPLLHQYVVDGDDWTGRLLAGDGEIEQTLSSLRAVPPHGEECVRLLLTLSDQVARHVVELEELVFPRLQAMSPATALRDAGVRAHRADAVASDSAEPARLTASFYGPWGRLRDWVRRCGRL
ncbi:hemerythrin domain-containing protein [Streptomyces griseofuscus]|uniref:hemerythrin domain-containing protein n=1 Tax=Streptomyces griseofuscus TaxID=146922 RepID=UPI0037F2A8F3